MQSNTVALPSEIDHIGIVVKDVDKTIKFLSSIMGIESWKTRDFIQSKDEVLVGEPFRLKIIDAKLGATTLELIQPVEGRSYHSQVLETKGEGLDHIAFAISNYDEMVSKLQEQGHPMVVGGEWHGIRWCYFGTKPGDIVVEFFKKP